LEEVSKWLQEGETRLLTHNLPAGAQATAWQAGSPLTTTVRLSEIETQHMCEVIKELK
jgi:hypothetical protein